MKKFCSVWVFIYPIVDCFQYNLVVIKYKSQWLSSYTGIVSSIPRLSKSSIIALRTSSAYDDDSRRFSLLTGYLYPWNICIKSNLYSSHFTVSFTSVLGCWNFICYTNTLKLSTSNHVTPFNGQIVIFIHVRDSRAPT